MNMDFWKRVDAEVKRNGLTLEKLYELANLKSGTTRGWRFYNRYPDAPAIVRIAKVLGVSVEWLITGDESAMLDDEYTKENKNAKQPNEDREENNRNEEPSVLIPIFSQKLSAGPGQELNDESDVTGYIRYPKRMTKGISPSSLGAAEVTGDSMEPLLYAGDLVIFADGEVDDSGIYVLSFHGAVLVKRLSFNYITDSIDIISENKAYTTISAKKEDQGLRILGKVISWIHTQPANNINRETKPLFAEKINLYPDPCPY